MLPITLIDVKIPTYIFVLAALYCTQSQAPPTPPTSPFAAAAIRRDPPAGRGTAVSLTFAWPAGMAATIEVERSKTLDSPEGRRTTGAAMRYRMRVAAHKDGRLIEYDNFEPIGIQLAAAEQSALVDIVSSLMPSLVVSNTGKFVRVGDLTGIRTAIRQITDAARNQAPAGAVPANLQALLDGLSTDEVLTRMAASDWEAFIGTLVGFEGKIGDAFEFESEEPSPVVPGLMVPMRTSFGAVRHAPCAPGHAGDSCVEMRVRSVVAPGGMQVVLKRMLEGVKALEGLRYDRFDVVTEVVTILEPSTMRPYQISQTKTADFTMTMPGKGSASASVTERRSFRLRYQ